MVPALPTLIVSKGYRVVAELLPDHQHKRYDIAILLDATDEQLAAAEMGTVRRDGRYADAYLEHQVGGVRFRTKISTLRGDYEKGDGTIANKLRQWDKFDFKPRPDDILQERLYCVQWMRPKKKGKGYEIEFRAVTQGDLDRELSVENFISANLAEWQARGYVPDMRIEVGGPPRYQGLDLIRGRGWTHWNHVFNARQLLVGGLVNKFSDARMKSALTQVLNLNSRLSGFDNSLGGAAATKGAFVNQALNTLYYYGARGTQFLVPALSQQYPSFPLAHPEQCTVENKPAAGLDTRADMFVTDPPYGDAVKYEEISRFFCGLAP
jgi:putative DNA methylase